MSPHYSVLLEILIVRILMFIKRPAQEAIRPNKTSNLALKTKLYQKNSRSLQTYVFGAASLLSLATSLSVAFLALGEAGLLDLERDGRRRGDLDGLWLLRLFLRFPRSRDLERLRVPVDLQQNNKKHLLRECTKSVKNQQLFVKEENQNEKLHQLIYKHEKYYDTNDKHKDSFLLNEKSVELSKFREKYPMRGKTEYTRSGHSPLAVCAAFLFRWTTFPLHNWRCRFLFFQLSLKK